MSHGEEGDRKTASEEQNEVNSQLVSKQKHIILKRQNIKLFLMVDVITEVSGGKGWWKHWGKQK